MGIEQLNFEGQNKVEIAIGLLKAFEPPEGYYVAFSGGKDSTIIYDLVKKSGVKYDVHYCVSPIDPPQLHKHIKKYYPEVQWDYHARGWWDIVVKKGLPMRQARWCCSIIKEAGGENRVVVIGNRRLEGGGRKKQNCFDMARNRQNKLFIRPIIDWSEAEVWQYIKTNNLPYCELYDKGFNRLGCVLCPFSRDIKREMLYFPKIVKCWQRACDRIIEKRLASDKTYKHNFQTGQELFEWWVSRS